MPLTPSAQFGKNLTPKAKALGSVKSGIKKVGRMIDSQLFAPSRRVKQYNTRADAMNRANARSGALNRGDAAPTSQTY